MAKRPLRLLVLDGPGSVESLRLAVLGRTWTILVNTTVDETNTEWPAAEPVWRKKRVDALSLNASSTGFNLEEDAKERPATQPERTTIIPDERRPGRRSCLIQVDDIAVGITAGSQQMEAPAATDRVVILDASWTHIARFPDREDVRESFLQALTSRARRIFYLTNLKWDADFFDEVAQEQGRAERAQVIRVSGFGSRMLWQAREVAPTVTSDDMVILGLVPRRDDRGAFQRLRSDFAERTEHVWAYPTHAVSCGPGPSREESLEMVGLWLPTRVLIAGGYVSEQVLLARHLEENAGGTGAGVAIVGGEYRLPSVALIHQVDAVARARTTGSRRRPAPHSGLVVVTYGRDGEVELSSAGLATEARNVLPKIRLSRRGKSPEQVVHDVETAFSSRGMPVPSVRYLP